MSAGKTMGERMVAVETWQTDHERRCDDRQAALGREIKDLKKGADGARNAFYALLLGLLAFFAREAYQSLKPAPSPVPAVASR